MTADTLLSLFRRDESWFQVRLWLKIIFGLPFCFIGPLVLASMLWFSTSMFGLSWPWTWWFLGLSVVMIPLLFRMEIRSEGNYLGEVSNSDGGILENSAAAVIMTWTRISIGLPIVPSSGNSPANARTGVAGFVEFFLQGPRYVLEGLRDRKSWKLFRQADRRRAADIVTSLSQRDRSVSISELLRVGEKSESLVPTLFYLSAFDWAGLGQDNPKVWLLTRAKERLGLSVR